MKKRKIDDFSDFRNLLEFFPEDGLIQLKGDRKLIVSAEAMGNLRMELINTFGIKIAKGVLMRYGYTCGYQDAMNLKKKFKWNNEKDIISAGPKMHMLEGIVKVTPVEMNIDKEKNIFKFKAIWNNSYEAEQHKKHFGISDYPVCWTLTGYASGFSSAVFGKEVISIEEKCEGKGDDCCLVKIKLAEEWGPKITEELKQLKLENFHRKISLLEEKLSKKTRDLRKQTRQLKDTMELLNSIYEGSTEYSIIAEDLNGKILTFNKGATLIYGYKPEEIIGKNARILHTKEDILSRKYEKIGEIVKKEGIFEGEELRVRKNGEVFPVRRTVTLRKDAKGNPVGFVVISKDITEEKKLEQQLKEYTSNLENIIKKRTEELIISEAKYRDLIENSPEIIYQSDPEGRIVSINETAVKKLGYTIDEFMKKRVQDLVPEEYKEKMIDHLSRVIKEGKSTVETVFLTKTGKKVYVEINSTGFCDSETGALKYTRAFVRDITDRKKLEAQIMHQEKMASLGLMAAGIAHEVGNPLTSISTIVQVFQRRTKDPFFLENIKTLRSNIERINKIVRELVDFSRPSSYNFENIQINNVIKNAIGIAKYDRRVKNIEIKSDLDSNLPIVRLIPDQLLQVLINIIFNAIDAIESSYGRILVSSKLENSRIKIEIEDNGIGIPRENLNKIFEPFYTTKKIGRGTGLGLTVSYGIIKNFGGTINVESEEGKGSKFSIILPINKIKEN
ncbi:hypothetical protein DRQ09_03630 [candidate division KSB1 bacterium]|nr:MAG: hypothetical protein DRQ09_03630 [candidate division KSB1 bacterium]